MSKVLCVKTKEGLFEWCGYDDPNIGDEVGLDILEDGWYVVAIIEDIVFLDEDEAYELLGAVEATGTMVLVELPNEDLIWSVWMSGSDECEIGAQVKCDMYGDWYTGVIREIITNATRYDVEECSERLAYVIRENSI